MKEKKDLSIQVLHDSKLGSPRATRAGRSAHSIALSGFQGAGRLPERGAARRCAVSGAGLTLSRLEGIASPAGEIFRKKTDEGFFRASRRLLPRVPHGGIAARGAPTRASHALPSPFSSLISTRVPMVKVPFGMRRNRNSLVRQIPRERSGAASVCRFSPVSKSTLR